MDLERVVCSSCRAPLEWKPKLRIFVCPNCGSIYRRAGDIELEKTEKALEQRKLEIETERQLEEMRLQAKKESRQDKINLICTVLGAILVAIIYAFLFSTSK